MLHTLHYRRIQTSKILLARITRAVHAHEVLLPIIDLVWPTLQLPESNSSITAKSNDLRVSRLRRYGLPLEHQDHSIGGRFFGLTAHHSDRSIRHQPRRVRTRCRTARNSTPFGVMHRGAVCT